MTTVLDKLTWFTANPPYRRFVFRTLLTRAGYDLEQWSRIVYVRAWRERIAHLDPSRIEALEISPGMSDTWRSLPFKSYTAVQYPEFDICEMTLPRQFDLVVADQVFEHLERPYEAGRNVVSMLKPNGHFLIATPFLIRVHGHPNDYTRWTPNGLRVFLEDCGFPKEGIETGAWGNRACVKANFGSWARFGFGRTLRNEPDFPVTVWAIARH